MTRLRPAAPSHGTRLQRGGQRKLKRLAGEGCLGGEIRCLNARGQCRVQGRGHRIPFYEYFHGDTGRGIGASHQSGWTSLIAKH